MRSTSGSAPAAAATASIPNGSTSANRLTDMLTSRLFRKRNVPFVEQYEARPGPTTQEER